MKSTSLIVALTVAFVASSGALASDQTKGAKPVKQSGTEQKKLKTQTPAKDTQIALTGSYIKKDVHRNGVVTDGANPVFVLDRQSIDASGASDLSQVLIRSGFRR